MFLWKFDLNNIIIRLVKREALLRGTETFYSLQDDRPWTFIGDYNKAMERNNRLREVERHFVGFTQLCNAKHKVFKFFQDVASLQHHMRREVEDKSIHRDFYTLKVKQYDARIY